MEAPEWITKHYGRDFESPCLDLQRGLTKICFHLDELMCSGNFEKVDEVLSSTDWAKLHFSICMSMLRFCKIAEEHLPRYPDAVEDVESVLRNHPDFDVARVRRYLGSIKT